MQWLSLNKGFTILYYRKNLADSFRFREKLGVTQTIEIKSKLDFYSCDKELPYSNKSLEEHYNNMFVVL